MLPTTLRRTTASQDGIAGGFTPLELRAVPQVGVGNVGRIRFRLAPPSDAAAGDWKPLVTSLNGHQVWSAAGRDAEGCVFVGLTCRVDGALHTAYGAFDPKGVPMAPTPAQKNILLGLMPQAPRPLTIDAKSKSVIGAKTVGGNPTVGAYVDLQKQTALFYFDGKAPDTGLSGDGHVELDRRGRLEAGHVNAKYAGDGIKAGLGLAKEGSAITRSINAAVGRFSADGKWKTDGDKLTREYSVSYEKPKSFKLKMEINPDATFDPKSIKPMKPVDIPSNLKLTLTIPLR